MKEMGLPTELTDSSDTPLQIFPFSNKKLLFFCCCCCFYFNKSDAPHQPSQNNTTQCTDQRDDCWNILHSEITCIAKGMPQMIFDESPLHPVSPYTCKLCLSCFTDNTEEISYMHFFLCFIWNRLMCNLSLHCYSI